MARVHFVKSARKAQPKNGIEKGDSYYWWQFYKSPKQFSKTRPKPSQLIASDKLSRATAASEELADAIAAAGSREDIEQALNDCASTVQEIADEYRESAENIRQSFSESPTADECDEKADQLEDWVSELESAASDVTADADEDDENDLENAKDSANQANSNPL